MPDTPEDNAFLGLNIHEMWAALIFQTLPHALLAPWLPRKALLHEEIHLNVSLPLAQGRQESAKDWLYLKKATDPVLKAYYEFRVESATKNLELGRKRRGGLAREQATRGEWVELKVYCRKRGNPRKTLKLRDVLLPLPTQLVLLPDKVFVHYDFRDDVHPHRVASKSQTEDPSMRLGIKLIGKSSRGTEVVHWVRTDGEKIVSRLNFLCDWLENVPKEETEKGSRRFYIKKPSQGKAREIYNP
jgi:hypothetical protein